MNFKISERRAQTAPVTTQRVLPAKSIAAAIAAYCEQRNKETMGSEHTGVVTEQGRGLYRIQVLRGPRIYYHYLHVEREAAK